MELSSSKHSVERRPARSADAEAGVYVDGSESGENHNDSYSRHGEKGRLLETINEPVSSSTTSSSPQQQPPIVSRRGLFVLTLLAVQNCSKNLLLHQVMKGQPEFLTSVAVLGTECHKLLCSVAYILLVERKSLRSIVTFLKEDHRNTLLLIVPAAAYNFQMSMEYVALGNLNAALFSVLVQSKLLFTATFAAVIMRKKLKYIQVISLVLLTTGVMMCNLSKVSSSSSSTTTETVETAKKTIKGIMATLAIAVSSGFASVYTEKVIKGPQGNKRTVVDAETTYGLAYTQVQLALMGILTIGLYACIRDVHEIRLHGMLHNFTFGAFLSICSSSIGGLIVASVLKYADSVLKGYATAISVIITGILSMLLFGTVLDVNYFMGIINVVTAVLLYNGKDLDQLVCAS